MCDIVSNPNACQLEALKTGVVKAIFDSKRFIQV
jgi:hypothetical protein